MKVNYDKIMEMMDSLSVLGSLKLPRAFSFAVVHNRRKIQPLYEEMYQQKMDIIKRYAKKDESGNFIYREDESGRKMYDFDTDVELYAYANELSDLRKIEQEVEIMKIKEEDIDKCYENPHYDILTPDQEYAIGWMIEEG